MSSASANSCPNCFDQLEFCHRLLVQLRSGHLNWDEFDYNFSLLLVQTCERCMPKAIVSLPAFAATKYLVYVREFLEPVDFKPCPKPFIAGVATSANIEHKRIELRPKYQRLYELAQEHAAGSLVLELLRDS